MDIVLSDLFSNLNTGLSQIGFFFDAGSSFAAGYTQLTIDVLKKLPTATRLQRGYMV